MTETRSVLRVEGSQGFGPFWDPQGPLNSNQIGWEAYEYINTHLPAPSEAWPAKRDHLTACYRAGWLFAFPDRPALERAIPKHFPVVRHAPAYVALYTGRAGMCWTHSSQVLFNPNAFKRGEGRVTLDAFFNGKDPT